MEEPLPRRSQTSLRRRIDITLTKDLRYDIIRWEVDRRYNASDHNTIKFRIGKEKIKLPKTWKWHKADWENC